MRRSLENNPGDDRELLASFRRGDPEACRVVEVWAAVSIRSVRLSIPPDEQADLIQETLTKLLIAAGREGFQLNHSFRGFVRKIAFARSIDWIRKRRIIVPLLDEWPSDSPDVLNDLSRREIAQGLRLALMELSTPCRRLIYQRFYERKTYQEIARSHDGIREGTLRVRLHDCLRRLRRITSDIV